MFLLSRKIINFNILLKKYWNFIYLFYLFYNWTIFQTFIILILLNLLHPNLPRYKIICYIFKLINLFFIYLSSIVLMIRNPNFQILYIYLNFNLLKFKSNYFFVKDIKSQNFIYLSKEFSDRNYSFLNIIPMIFTYLSYNHNNLNLNSMKNLGYLIKNLKSNGYLIKNLKSIMNFEYFKNFQIIYYPNYYNHYYKWNLKNCLNFTRLF